MTVRGVRYENKKPVVSQNGFITNIGMEIRCYSIECSAAYRIDYTTNEVNIDVGELRRVATAKVNETHPHHPDVILLRS